MKGLLLIVGLIREENERRFTRLPSEVRAGNDSRTEAESSLFQLQTWKTS